MLFGKIPPGNLIMSFATLMFGMCISKVFLVFNHLGVMAISLRTFFQYHRFVIILQSTIPITMNILRLEKKNQLWIK